MSRIVAVFSALAFAAVASCNRAPRISTPAPGEQALAGYGAQRLIVAPTGMVRADSLGWSQQLGGARMTARRLDSSLVAALADRGLAARWVLPAELARVYERNRSYAADPYQLALEPLRAPTFAAASVYGEPLSTQLRTMIALHENSRFVFVPVELRFEREGTAAAGRGVLRVALLDPRFAEAKWVGELTSDTSSMPSRALASLASRIAGLFTEP